MCVPPGTSTLEFAFLEIGVVVGGALPDPVDGAAAGELEGCAELASGEGCAVGDDAGGFCPAGLCVEGCAGGAAGKGPSCWAKAELPSATNAKTTVPANRKRSPPFFMCCPQYCLSK